MILLVEFHDSQTDRQTGTRTDTQLSLPSDASCWCQEFFNALRIKSSRLNWVGLHNEDNQSVTHRLQAHCSAHLNIASSNVSWPEYNSSKCSQLHTEPCKICWSMYCRIFTENGQTDRQTGILTIAVAIPKQTRLKPASLIVRYKAPTYLILLLFSFWQTPYVFTYLTLHPPTYLPNYLPTCSSIHLPTQHKDPLRSLPPDTKENHTTPHSVQLTYQTVFETSTCQAGAQLHVRADVKASWTRGVAI